MKFSIRLVKKTVIALLLAGTLFFTSSCWLLVVGAVAGAAAVSVAYVDGNLEVTYGNSFENVVTATNKAIAQLEFAKPEERQDMLSDTLSTHTAAGDAVKVVITKVSDTATKVNIRVNTLGDEALSMSINDKIKSNL